VIERDVGISGGDFDHHRRQSCDSRARSTYPPTGDFLAALARQVEGHARDALDFARV
jgi:hypothetical protein